jgi:hypothetical protein
MKNQIIQFSFFIFLFTSCSIVYYPNRLNVPLLSSEKELVANGAVGANGADVQAAYAVNDFFALQVSGNTYYNSNEYQRNIHQYGDFGFGYYLKTDKLFKLEVFGGVGAGRGEDKKYDNGIVNDYAQGYYYKIFVQPNIGLSNDYFDFAFSTRISNVNFYNFSSTYTGVPINGVYQRELENGPFLFNTLFIEPALTAGLGYKMFKATAQLGFALPVYEPSYDYNPLIMNIGLQFKNKLKSKSVAE